MIFNFFILVVTGMLGWFVGLLPNSTGFPQAAHNAMNTLGGYLGIWEPLIPISTLATVLGLVFAVEIGIFGFKTFKWLISHLPQIGGKG